MPAINLDHRIAYFDVPKSGSTALKHVFFELESGRPFPYSEDPDFIHFYISTTQSHEMDHVALDGFWTFAMVRDPISRILATYGNRVLHYGALTQSGSGRLARVKRRLLPRRRPPTLDEFCIHLQRWRHLNRDVHHHTQPVNWFLGPHLGRFDAVYRLDQMPALHRELEARIGRPVVIPRLQTGGPKFRPSDLSDEAFDSLVAFTRRDYEYLDGLYTVDEVLKARRDG